MFRATMCPSSGEITIYLRYWCLSFCMGGSWSAGWSETPTSRPGATHKKWQTPVSQRYSNIPWWWTHGCPKHVEKRNKYTKQNCAPSWIYLQDCTRMHGQQNIRIVRAFGQKSNNFSIFCTSDELLEYLIMVLVTAIFCLSSLHGLLSLPLRDVRGNGGGPSAHRFIYQAGNCPLCI